MAASVCNENYFNQLYLDQAPGLRNHLYYKCGDLQKAEDLLQDTFVKVWDKCAEVVLSTVVGFIYTVANRLFLDQARKVAVNLKFEKSQTQQHDEADPHYALRTKEFQEQIEKAISELPDGQREAFLLNRIDKLTYKEIGQRLEISSTAVEKRMTKAILTLKKKVEEFKTYGI